MLGLDLGLYQPQLDAIKVDNPGVQNCLRVVLTMWLNQTYDVQKFGEPSWPVKAVSSTIGGSNPALAQDITQKYNESTE